MRVPEYLSPTSVKLFYDDVELFYQRYLSDNKKARDPQTQPMAIGSAFDAFVKSYLHEKLFGKGADPKYDLRTLFESQVEESLWDWAWRHGQRVFDQYKSNGCLADLMLELGQAIGPPRFEFDVRGEMEGVPLLGKPDVFFLNKEGARVIYDWKVNGYCAKALKSPMKGYLKLRDGDKVKQHKDCVPFLKNGIEINAGMFLEQGDQGWASQLAIYGWLLGEAVGSDQLIVGIDQICGPASRLRFATHRCRISPDFQFALLENITNVWDAIINEHVFQDMTKEESLARCKILDHDESEDEDFRSISE